MATGCASCQTSCAPRSRRDWPAEGSRQAAPELRGAGECAERLERGRRRVDPPVDAEGRLVLAEPDDGADVRQVSRDAGEAAADPGRLVATNLAGAGLRDHQWL